MPPSRPYGQRTGTPCRAGGHIGCYDVTVVGRDSPEETTIETLALGALALVAGVVSFTSPCALPLLPGYVSYVAALDDAGGSRRVWAGAALFVAGFTIVFTALGATASALGQLLASQGVWLDRVGGAVIIIMGLVLAGVLRPTALLRERRVDLSRVGRGPAGALPLGAAFALGWTPCIGPALASILALSAGRTTVGQGAALLLIYSVGMGLPFLAVAAGVRRGQQRLAWARRHSRTIEIAGGVLLVGMGVMLLTGAWSALMSDLLSLYARVGWPPI